MSYRNVEKSSLGDAGDRRESCTTSVLSSSELPQYGSTPQHLSRASIGVRPPATGSPEMVSPDVARGAVWHTSAHWGTGSDTITTTDVRRVVTRPNESSGIAQCDDATTWPIR